MGLSEKIEEIRKRPEHVRMRYVWFFVAISMILVLTIWYFSAKSDMIQEQSSMPDLSGTVGEFNQQKNSLQSILNNAENSLGQNANNAEQAQNAQNPQAQIQAGQMQSNQMSQ